MASSSSSSGSFARDFIQAAYEGKLKLLKRMVSELGRGDGLATTVASVKDEFDQTVLEAAAAGGQTHVCKYLIEALKLDVNMRNRTGETPLHRATRGDHLATATYLLEIGANLTAANEDKWTALHFAAGKGFNNIMGLLISKGAEVDVEGDCGTPLQWASANGKDKAVKFLLENNADPNRVFDHNYTPLKVSILAKSLECVKLLLKAGADPNIHYGDGVTALEVAACKGETEMIRCLLKAGADPNIHSYGDGVTGLEVAACKGETEMIRCLLKAGANPNAINDHGLTAIEVAALFGNPEAVMVLFPVTSRIPQILDWSPWGINNYVHSNEARKQCSPRMKLGQKEYFSFSKSVGKFAFEKKDYLSAIHWYSEAIKSDPTDAVVLSNRSLCWARLNDGMQALSDAKACLLLRPDWSKAYYRQGVAWNLLEQNDKAAKSFRDGLKLDPENKELQTASEIMGQFCSVMAGSGKQGASNCK